jgi:hypothetical protein
MYIRVKTMVQEKILGTVALHVKIASASAASVLLVLTKSCTKLPCDEPHFVAQTTQQPTSMVRRATDLHRNYTRHSAGKESTHLGPRPRLPLYLAGL